MAIKEFKILRKPSSIIELSRRLRVSIYVLFISREIKNLKNNFHKNGSSSRPPPLRVSAGSNPKARFVARRKESVPVRQLDRPLSEYMSLPASQYSVLDAERIERVDDNTFRCYVYRFKFFAFEVCPVLLVRVEEQPDGCCIKLLSCKLEGSPIVAAQNDKFDASMVNRISYDSIQRTSSLQQLTSDTTIELVKDYQAWASGDTSRQPLGTGKL
ncbi:hypothetical protein BT93_G1297 [Corymbia citriodora subsp. variegata]|nr:hypothetical protein BT93_G1297 [Corymbia citriodora subsp. variegata]